MASRYLRTSDIAKAIGAHPNTIRLYEQWGFLPPIPRSPSGYRLYTPYHLSLMRLAWTALHESYPCKPLIVIAVKKAAVGDLGGALEQSYKFLAQVRAEQAQAEAAVEFMEHWAQGNTTDVTSEPLLIGQVAKRLGVTIDMLHNWERDGLLSVPRKPRNGYRVYGATEIGRIRVIRMLRQAGYSTMAILRMLLALDQGQSHDLRQMLDTPRPDEDVYTAADRWLSTLAASEQRALTVIGMIHDLMAMPQPKPLR